MLVLVQMQKVLKVLPWLCKVTNPVAKDGRARIRFVSPWPPHHHLMHFKEAELLAERVKEVDKVSHSTSTSTVIHSQASLPTVQMIADRQTRQASWVLWLCRSHGDILSFVLPSWHA